MSSVKTVRWAHFTLADQVGIAYNTVLSGCMVSSASRFWEAVSELVFKCPESCAEYCAELNPG